MSTHRFALTLARCSGAADALWACPCPSNRFASFDCALRFAPCARHFSPSGLRRPATGTRMHFCVSHRPSIQHGRSAPSHRAAFSGPVFRGCALRFAPCARHFSPSGLRTLASSLVALPASLESSYRPALRWPGIPWLRSASRCPRPSTPSGLRRLRPVSATGGGLRALPQFSMVVLLRLAACNTPLLIGLTTACFRHWRRPSCAPRNMPKKRAKKASGAGGFSPGHLL